MKSKLFISIILNILLIGCVGFCVFRINKIKDREQTYEERVSLYVELDRLRGEIVKGDTNAFSKFFQILKPDYNEKPLVKYPDADLFYYSMIAVHKCHDDYSSWLVVHSLYSLNRDGGLPDSLFRGPNEYYQRKFAQAYYNKDQDSLWLDICEQEFADTEYPL